MKYKPGDKLETEEIGECTVTDVYTSEYSDQIVYELIDKEGTNFYFPEEDITLTKL